MIRRKLLGTILAVSMTFNMTAAAFAAENVAVDIEAAEDAVSEDVLEETFESEKDSEKEAKAADYSEIPGTTTIKKAYDSSFDYITGYASVDAAVKERGQFLGTEKHKKVATAAEFAEAVKGAREGKVKIIELTADINLGYNSFTAEEKNTYRSFVSEYKKPSPNASIKNMAELNGFTNPKALESGVSSFKLSEINGLTIFSLNGSSISYAELNINRNANDIVIRNIHFKNMWQWDDDGNQKAVGWSNLKLNEGHNIWIDHCSFDAAFDGNIDVENGASGISITWCKIGQTLEEAVKPGNAIYDSVTFMESLYKDSKLTTGLYKNMRDAGATPTDIMQYSAYHDKCHLCGSGDKDYVDYSDSIKDSNGNIRITLAYNHYLSIGQRLPMIRQGVGHLFNCYIDDSLRQDVLGADGIRTYAPSNYKMSRCLNARNGACIAADTCVFEGVEQPVIGAEIQGYDTGNMSGDWPTYFKNAYNRSLIVNSKVVNSKGTYVGSNWDNNGVNAFTSNFTWKDKSTIGNWAWSSSIVGIENFNKSNPPKDENGKAIPFEFTYNTDEKLPYTYKVMPLESVESVVTTKAGCDFESTKTAEQWCQSYEPVSVEVAAKITACEEKIEAIGTVELTDACKTRIDAARKAYDELPLNGKANLSNYGILVSAEKVYSSAKEAADLIDALGTVEYTEVFAVSLDEAKKTYDSLGADAQAIVTNHSVLENALAAFDRLSTERVNDVILRIDAIGTVVPTDACKAKIDAARDAYNETLERFLSRITNYSTLTDAEKMFKSLKGEVATGDDTLVTKLNVDDKGKIKGIVLSEPGKEMGVVTALNGLVTVNAKVKVMLPESEWKLVGYYEGRAAYNSLDTVQWKATEGTKDDLKAISKYAKVKFDAKNKQTVVTTVLNKKVPGGVYAVKLIDKYGNCVCVNIECLELNKEIKKSALAISSVDKAPAYDALLAMEDSGTVKTVGFTMLGTERASKSAFNSNTITWQVGSGKTAITLTKGKVFTIADKKAVPIGYVAVADDGTVKVLSGTAKGSIKLTASINGTAYKTAVAVK